MNLNKIRQLINDSKIGQTVNNSLPGLLTEGASRMLEEPFYTAAAGFYAASPVLGMLCLPAGFASLTTGAICQALGYDREPEFEKPEEVYSLKSQLYESCNDGRMKRRSFWEVLGNRLNN
ncbi:hypothetical protein KY328_05855 [Candidatus Woesearchaeota archaeon]|nr:hypothetical protein [Candidatus Woesearchaeota archaeon]MBW3022424.1 hypothetical protein [Candidatus Woesearchaeota archaeon]